jgi:hypothetical protein
MFDPRQTRTSARQVHVGRTSVTMRRMDARRTLAALNNAEWCDVMARSHGVETEIDREVWIARTRTPPYYPDAVTLVPEPAIPDLLRRIDASAGCSIKDSFATLDLAGFGFRVLFDARWITRRLDVPAAAGVEPAWVRIHEASALAAWETAWSGGAGLQGLFRADLLALDAVTVLVAYEADRIVAGAVLNRSTDVVGVSNVFSLPGRERAAWQGCLARASTLYPGATMVGYQWGRDLDIALDHGFEIAGPLRVWIQD